MKLQERCFSKVKIMWAIAMFDLPVKKKKERKLDVNSNYKVKDK